MFNWHIDEKGLINSEGLKKAFMLCVSVGMFSIFFGSFLPWSEIFIIIIPIGMMFFYIYLYIAGQQPEYLVDTFSDSIYYLGFIFTVTSLISTMLSFGLSTELSASNVLSKFGVAMITTLIGLSARVYFKQFNVSSDSVHMEVKQTFTDSLITFKADISIMTRHINKLSKKLIDQTVAIDEASKNSFENISQLSLKAKEIESSALNSLEDTVKKKNSDFIDTLTKSQRLQSVDLLRLFKESTEKQGRDTLNMLSEAFDDSYERLVEQHEKTILSSIENSGVLTENLNSLNDTFKNYEDRLSGLSNTMEGQEKVFTIFKSSISSANEDLDRFSTLTTLIADSISKFNSINDKFDDKEKLILLEMDKINESYENISKTLLNISNSKDLNNLDQLSAAVIKEMTERLGSVKNLNNEWKNEVKKITDSSSYFSDALIEIANDISKNIKK